MSGLLWSPDVLAFWTPLPPQMRVAGSTEARQKRILEATITKTDYHSMDADGDGLVSPYEFMCRTLVAQVSELFFRFPISDFRLQTSD